VRIIVKIFSELSGERELLEAGAGAESASEEEESEVSDTKIIFSIVKI
jgi:hypothetical protein